MQSAQNSIRLSNVYYILAVIISVPVSNTDVAMHNYVWNKTEDYMKFHIRWKFNFFI